MTDLERTVVALVLALAMAHPSTGAAGAAGERIFAPGVFNAVAEGSVLVYGHVREGNADAEMATVIPDGEVRVFVGKGSDGTREAVIRMSENGNVRELPPLPATVGNPLLVTFLESILYSIARITHGSPFYIRNRMKEALRNGGEIVPTTAVLDGKEIAAETITFHPFIEDKNRDRMGPFAELELRFVTSDDAPGGFLLMSAQTGPADDGTVAFREEISLRRLGDGG